MFDKRINLIFIALLPIICYVGVKLLIANVSHPICIFKILTGHDCWGCGMTRAFNALFDLHFREAYAFNPRIVIVAPLMLWIWINMLLKQVSSLKKVEK